MALMICCSGCLPDGRDEINQCRSRGELERAMAYFGIRAYSLQPSMSQLGREISTIAQNGTITVGMVLQPPYVGQPKMFPAHLSAASRWAA